MRLRILLAVLALAISVSVYAGLSDRGVNQWPVAPNFERRVLPIHLTGWTATGNRVKVFYMKNHLGPLVVTRVNSVVRAMSGTISAFTAQLTKNDLNCLSAAIDMYSTGLATAGTYRAGTLINDPTVYKDGDFIGIDIVFTGTDTPTVGDLDINLEYRPLVGQEFAP